MSRVVSAPSEPTSETPPAAEAKRAVAQNRGSGRVPAWVLLLAGAGTGVAFGLVGPGLQMGAPLVLMGLGGLVLVWCGLTFWRIVDPLLREQAGPGELAARVPVRRRDLEREKQLVLKAIREIDLDHQMRKISDADHKEMTQRYRNRALRLLRELDAGDDYRTLIEQELKSRLAAGSEAANAGTGAVAVKGNAKESAKETEG